MVGRVSFWAVIVLSQVCCSTNQRIPPRADPPPQYESNEPTNDGQTPGAPAADPGSHAAVEQSPIPTTEPQVGGAEPEESEPTVTSLALELMSGAYSTIDERSIPSSFHWLNSDSQIYPPGIVTVDDAVLALRSYVSSVESIPIRLHTLDGLVSTIVRLGEGELIRPDEQLTAIKETTRALEGFLDRLSLASDTLSAKLQEVAIPAVYEKCRAFREAEASGEAPKELVSKRISALEVLAGDFAAQSARIKSFSKVISILTSDARAIVRVIEIDQQQGADSTSSADFATLELISILESIRDKVDQVWKISLIQDDPR